MKSFIICLPKIVSSYNSAIELKQALLDIDIDAELFEGTYGNDAELLFLKENRNIHIPVEENNRKWNSPGVKGCFHSHYTLWKYCVKIDQPILIFEDDVVIKRKFEPVDFEDILILSINYDWKVTTPYRKYYESPEEVAYAADYHLQVMPGASGYIIKPHAAKKLLTEYATSFYPADLAINSNLCKMQIHSKLIGRSKTIKEKTSLTRSKTWKN